MYVFPGGSDGEEPAHNVGDLGSTPGSGRFPEEGSVFLPGFSLGESNEQRSLVGYSPQGRKDSDMTEQLTHNTNMWVIPFLCIFSSIMCCH